MKRNTVRTCLILMQLLMVGVMAQAKEKVAILETVAEEVDLGPSALSVLTDQFRSVALQKLPTSRYHIMTKDNIMMMLPPGTEISECVGECLVETGRNVNAHLVTQGKVTKVGTRFFFTASLYETKKSQLLGQVTVMAQDIDGLVDGIISKAPELFQKVTEESSAPPMLLGGIQNVNMGTGASLNLKKMVLVDVYSEPVGALVTMDGKPLKGCPKTPCKIEVSEGPHQFFGVLDKHQDAEAKVLIDDSTRVVNLNFVSNFGILNVEPKVNPYGLSDLQVLINNKTYSSGNIELNPGYYEVKVSHPCFETAQFNAGVAMGQTQVFNQALQPKQAGIMLSATSSGKPQATSVFINSENVGQTPWSGEINVCSKIGVGDKEIFPIELGLKQGEVVQYTADLDKLSLARQKEQLAKNNSVIQSSAQSNSTSSDNSSWVGETIGVLGWLAVIGGGVYWALAYDDYENGDYQDEIDDAVAYADIEDYRKAVKENNDAIKQQYYALGVIGGGFAAVMISWAF